MDHIKSNPRRIFLLCAVAYSSLAYGGAIDQDELHTRDHAPFHGPWQATAPRGLGYEDTAPIPDETRIPPYVDHGHSNQRGNAAYATQDTNAAVRLLSSFLSVWAPVPAADGVVYVDAGTSAAATGNFPAVAPTTWSGLPGVAPDGTILNDAVHQANIQYVVQATQNRTPEQAAAAYFDDRRAKGYSITDGLGPLTSAWRTAAGQYTTITSIPADATTVRYDEKGNDLGLESSPTFGTAVWFAGYDLDGSVEPAKRYFKYARPWRWSTDVVVVPELEPAKSSTPVTDGGYTSGHSAEATRDALMMAYILPERFQELISRGLELGESRIFAGMHTPLDVMSGRMHGQAVIAHTLYAQQQGNRKNAAGNVEVIADKRQAAYDQAHSVLMAAVGASDLAAFHAYAHSGTTATDRFADHATNKVNYLRRLTYGFERLDTTDQPAVVPKGAEILLETRLPYLNAEQRRVVLKMTALPAGYPALDDAEGWGRLNLFDAADGYGTFDGDVTVSMDAGLGGYHAVDHWRNNISGEGKLTKQGSGLLKLSGKNSYSGGTHLLGGALQADSESAFGRGDVYAESGSVIHNARGRLKIRGDYTQLSEATLQVNLDRPHAHIDVSRQVTLKGGKLVLNFGDGHPPRKGSWITVMEAERFKGRFDTISVKGSVKRVTPFYGREGLRVRIDG